ncbi:MAG: nucleoside recognition domain-containing protein [Eubacteriales bacterium]|jgi:spore maturation protein A
MLGKCFSVICIVSVIFAMCTKNISNLSNAVVDGASRAVELSLSLLGVMCLWSGLMELLRSAGVVRKIAQILRPILRLAFPRAFKTGIGAEEITMNISANMLGIGNAATPFAIAAMKAMREGQIKNGNKESTEGVDLDVATDDMITLAVLNASSLDLLPTTIIALRRAAGSADPYSIIVPVWICSAAGSVLAVLLCRFFAVIFRQKKRRQEGGCGQGYTRRVDNVKSIGGHNKEDMRSTRAGAP